MIASNFVGAQLKTSLLSSSLFSIITQTSSNNDVFLILKQSEGKGVYIYIFQNAKQCYQINHLKENIAK